MYFDYIILQLIQSNKFTLFKNIQKMYIEYEKMLQINSNCNQNEKQSTKLSQSKVFTDKAPKKFKSNSKVQYQR